MSIKILPSAIEDLYAGRLFYDKQGEGLGEYFFDSIFSDIDSLALLADETMNGLTICKPGQKEAAQLATMLCEDNVLRANLGMDASNRPTATDFLKKLSDWCLLHRATTYAIVIGDCVIGTISLSHRSNDGKFAKIGYWIGSRYRGHGFGRKAFTAVLEKAAKEGIVSLSATIGIHNIPSRNIWERHGGTIASNNAGKLKYDLDLRVAVNGQDLQLPSGKHNSRLDDV